MEAPPTCPFCAPPVELITNCFACRRVRVPDDERARELMRAAHEGRPLPEPARDGESLGANDLFADAYRCGACHQLVGCICPRCHRNVNVRQNDVVKRQRRNPRTAPPI